MQKTNWKNLQSDEEIFWYDIEICCLLALQTYQWIRKAKEQETHCLTTKFIQNVIV